MNGLFTTFINSLVSLVFCMAAGYVCRKTRLIDDRLSSGLSSLLVKLTLPCTVFMSLMRPFSQRLLLESVATFALSAAVYLFGGLLGLLLARCMKAAAVEKRIWVFALIFANVGYMGFPVSQALFGDEALIYASMANASFNLLVFTVGVRLFNPKEEPKPSGPGHPAAASGWRMIVLNPPLIATLAGFVCFVTGFRLPLAINDGIGLLGAMTTPISMLLVGAALAKNNLRSLFTDIKAFPVVAARLVVIPLAAFAAMRLFVPNQVMLGVLVLLPAMPVASLTVIFAEQYRGDTERAVRLVALSNLLCVATMPLISLLLRLN